MATTEATQKPAIQLTEEAVRQAKLMLGRQKDPNTFLRLGVMGGGCSGYSYVMKLDTELSPRDQLFEYDGLRVAVDARSLRLLEGTVLEYTGDLMTGGFEFRNPNAKKSCGCGVSFNV